MPEPEKIEPSSLADYLETMSKSVFQTGISWRVVESKWPDIRQAFRDFDPNVVANLSESDLDELTNDRLGSSEIAASSRQSWRTLDVWLSWPSFMATSEATSASHGDFEKTVSDLRKQFRFLGDMGAYHFLYVVSEEVPSYEDWCASRGRTPVNAYP